MESFNKLLDEAKALVAEGKPHGTPLKPNLCGRQDEHAK